VTTENNIDENNEKMKLRLESSSNERRSALSTKQRRGMYIWHTDQGNGDNRRERRERDWLCLGVTVDENRFILSSAFSNTREQDESESEREREREKLN
jgi:hypothetical protein